MSDQEEILIEAKNLKKYFPIKSGMFSSAKAHVRAVDGVDFTIKRGEVFGVVGESGCGKTNPWPFDFTIDTNYRGNDPLFGFQYPEYEKY